MKDQPNFLSENGPSPAKKSFDRLTKQPTYFRLLQVDGFPLVSAVSRTLLASQSTHLTKVRYSVLYFAWKLCPYRPEKECLSYVHGCSENAEDEGRKFNWNWKSQSEKNRKSFEQRYRYRPFEFKL